MKQGVVRRIDNLGRIVIPKEIRKSLRIQNGDNLEIFLDNDSVVLKKYSQMDKLTDIISSFTRVVDNIIITSNDKVISSSNRNYIDEKISDDLIDIINMRKEKEEFGKVNITKKDTIIGNYIIKPIISGGDVFGLVIMFKEELSQEDKNTIKIICDFLSSYIE